uniref:Uncharacterized protein n=1 Tax=Arundo donax TaxID=35708 RepID=A0A0A9E161_ARUDO
MLWVLDKELDLSSSVEISYDVKLHLQSKSMYKNKYQFERNLQPELDLCI